MKDLNIDDAEYYVPGVIYEASENGQFSIYAFKGDMPTPETPLFAAPFFNVTGAKVCLGTAKIEKPVCPTFTVLLDYFEKRFWLTEFSHLGAAGNPTKSNLVLVTKNAHDCPFDMNELKPLNRLKLKDILK